MKELTAKSDYIDVFIDTVFAGIVMMILSISVFFVAHILTDHLNTGDQSIDRIEAAL